MCDHECLANFVLSVDISNNNNNNNNNKVKLLYFKWIFSSSSLGIFYMKRLTCVLETLRRKKTPQIWYLYKKHQRFYINTSRNIAQIVISVKHWFVKYCPLLMKFWNVVTVILWIFMRFAIDLYLMLYRRLLLIIER